MIATPRSMVSVANPVLYVAFELAKQQWKLAMTCGFGVAPILQTVDAADWRAVERALTTGGKRLGLPAAVRVVSCYEAGRDGFWIHRALTERGVENRVVDSSSIEVKRRARRTKTDRMDALKLVAMLVRACLGEKGVSSEIRVPTEEAEAARHRSRERQVLTEDQTRLVTQMRSGLATYGASLPRRSDEGWWTRVRDWKGERLPATVQARLARAQERLRVLTAQIAQLEDEQAAAVRAEGAAAVPLQRLVQLKSVGTTSASVLIDEGLVWRAFANRRQIGGLLGFAPTKYESGETRRDQGMSRPGNDRWQSVMAPLAWSWVRWQPESALTQWYGARFGTGKRARKVGIVALAHKLLIALWRWATQGILPTGAILKTA